jgi:tetratricopeptide (TPR) repeat protein
MPAVLLVVLLFAAQAVAQEDPLRQAARFDSEQKCEAAERIYQRALAEGSPSPALLNNAGNHYLLCGDAEKARSYFERLLARNPQHPNANLQLARFAADRHEGARALEYLSRLHEAEPGIRLLRAEALHWAGKRAEANALLDSLQSEIGGDPRLVFLYGLTCARIAAYDRAEAAFNAVLAERPDDFDVLLNLGRAAARASHLDRARRALEVALQLHPESVDAMVELSQVCVSLEDYPRAIYLLAQAKKIAPQRPEILLALARAAQAGEYYGDAAVAYDEYLRLQPTDDGAQRDRALVCGLTDSRQTEGLRELTEYVRKHPGDPLAHFGLARLSWRSNPQGALDQLASAVRLDPQFAAAHVDRAWLLNRLGRAAEAIPDLQQAIEIHPRDARALDLLGVTYNSLDRPAEAETTLRRALAISPDDPDVLLHLGRALMELGREQEAQPLLARFQSIRPKIVRTPWKQPGMIESATLSPAERTRRDIDRLKREAQAHPDDPELQLRLASLLGASGRVEEAMVEFRALLAKNVERRVWQQAGTFLLGMEQYPAAREFLERAAAVAPEANLDLAVAVLFTEGPEHALKTLERTPEGARSGDYLLLKAKILDAEGRTGESERLLEQGLRVSISRPRIVLEAALLLVRHRRLDLALDLLDHSAGEDPDLLLTRAIVLSLTDRNPAAELALKQIESQWPEWDRAYLAHGLLLEHLGKSVEAKQKLRTAVALGSADPASCANGLEDVLFSACARR